MIAIDHDEEQLNHGVRWNPKRCHSEILLHFSLLQIYI